MRRYILICCVAVLAALGLTACGGSTPHSQKSQLVRTLTAPNGQRSYRVKLPNGQVVTQAHDPRLAQPSPKAQLPRYATGISTVEQYDSVTISTIPHFAHYVAGYVNGLYRTYFALRSAGFPVVIGISVFRSGGADCLDMEPGNPPASAAGPWARWQFTQRNSRPCEYSMLSWMNDVRRSLTASGVRVCVSSTQNHCVRLWDANWTYVRHLDRGYLCTQWTDHSGGVNRDESTCAKGFYRRSVPPKPRPKPKPKPLPPHNPFNVTFNRCFVRGFVVHWDRLHHHRVPSTNLVFSQPGCQSGYNSGWKAARHK